MRVSTTGIVGAGLASARWRLNLNLNRVSDDNYWRDFSRTAARSRSACWPTTARWHWGRGDFSFTARALKWQTLQDVSCADRAALRPRCRSSPARYDQHNLAGGLESLRRSRLHPLRVGPAC